MQNNRPGNEAGALERPQAAPSEPVPSAFPAGLHWRQHRLTSALLAIGVTLFAIFVVILPAGVLSAALLVTRRESRRPASARLCAAVDATAPASKPCWAADGERFCERHRPGG